MISTLKGGAPCVHPPYTFDAPERRKMLTEQEAIGRYPGAVSFKYGDSAALNAEVLALVLSGKKTVTCGAVAGFERDGEEKPVVGRVDIALDWDGNPVAAVRTVAVEVIPFDKMPEALIAPQGEFRDLAHWRAGYEAYLTRAGLFAPDVAILVETFEVVERFLMAEEDQDKIGISDCKGVLQRRLKQLYSEARAFVEHEDDLVDRRLKWVITVSGFLFAAYGGTMIASASPGIATNPDLQVVLSGVRIAIGIVGFVSALIGAQSIHAAHLAIRGVTRKYNIFLEYNKTDILYNGLQVWKLIGDKLTHLPGFNASVFNPYLIAFVWSALIAIECSPLALGASSEGNVDAASPARSANVTMLFVILPAVCFAIVWGAIGFHIYLCIGELKKSGERSSEEQANPSLVTTLSNRSFERRILKAAICQNTSHETKE